MTEPMRPIDSLDDVIVDAEDPRLLALPWQLSCAFMLCHFARLGAPVTPPVLGWARATLWRSGATAPC